MSNEADIQLQFIVIELRKINENLSSLVNSL